MAWTWRLDVGFAGLGAVSSIFYPQQRTEILLCSGGVMVPLVAKEIRKMIENRYPFLKNNLYLDTAHLLGNFVTYMYLSQQITEVIKAIDNESNLLRLFRMFIDFHYSSIVGWMSIGTVLVTAPLVLKPVYSHFVNSYFKINVERIMENIIRYMNQQRMAVEVDIPNLRFGLKQKKLTEAELERLAPKRCPGLRNLVDQEEEYANPTECSICLGDFTTDQLHRYLPCKHPFHASCIDSWLLEQELPTCPICKKPLFESTSSSPEASITSSVRQNPVGNDYLIVM